MVLIRQPDDATLDEACRLLGQGELVAIPTETVYGLAANAWDADAVSKIFAAKNRPANNPLIVHIGSLDQIERAVALPLNKRLESQLAAIADLWPGPLTVVLPANKKIPSIVTAGHESVAVRMPSHPVALALLNKCPFPIAAPSANRSKYVSPTTAQHCAAGLGTHLSMIIDGGPCNVGVESTIVSLLDGGPRLLRPGGVTAEELADRLGVSVEKLASRPEVAEQSAATLLAPGMMREHYSPQTRLCLVGQEASVGASQRVGRIAFAPLSEEAANQYLVVETLSKTGDLNEVSRKLFAAIRRLDQEGLDLIVVDVCQPVGIGRAIMDRLERSAAGHS